MKKRALFLSLMLGLILASHAFAADTLSPSSRNIASYDANSLIKIDGSLWVWGDYQPVPTQITELSDVQTTFAGGYVQKKDGSVWLWERKIFPQKLEIKPVTGLKHIVDVFNYGPSTLALDEQGTVYVGTIADVNRPEQPTVFTPLPGLEDVAKIQGYHAYAEEQYIFLKNNGAVWKDNNDLKTFEPISGLSDVVQIEYNMAVKKDGTVWTWPADTGPKMNKPSAINPSQIKPLAGIKEIKARRYSNFAIDNQARLWFWGATHTGLSDNATFYEYPVPILFTEIKNVKDVDLAENNIIVLTTDGNVWTTSTYRDTMPANAEFTLLATNVDSIQSGPRHIIFQKTDGTLWGWGVNKHAELGYGDYKFMYTVPVPVRKTISISLNGENVPLISGLITQNGQNFIPMRSIFEKLGAQVTFDGSNKVATVARTASDAPEVTISVNATTGETKVNGQIVTLPTKPFTINGTLYLPLRFISEKLGASVDWLPQEERIAITMK